MPHLKVLSANSKNPNFEDSIELPITDLATAQEVFSAQRIFGGEQVIGMVIVPDAALDSGTSVVTVNRNGTAISGLSISVTSSLTAGTQSTDLLTTPLTLSAGDVLSAETNGGGTASGGAPARVSIIVAKHFRS